MFSLNFLFFHIEKEINELSEQRKTLLDNLKSNLKDLQEAQALAAAEPSAENGKCNLIRHKELLVLCHIIYHIIMSTEPCGGPACVSPCLHPIPKLTTVVVQTRGYKV